MKEPKCLFAQKSKANITRIDSMIIFFASGTREHYELSPINNHQNNITIDKIRLERSKDRIYGDDYSLTISFNTDIETIKNLKKNYSSFKSDLEVCIKINNYFIKSNMDFKNATFVNCERDNPDDANSFKSIIFGCLLGSKKYNDMLMPAYHYIKEKYENKDSDINISAAIFVHPNEKGDYSYLDNCQSAEELFKEF